MSFRLSVAGEGRVCEAEKGRKEHTRWRVQHGHQDMKGSVCLKVREKLQGGGKQSVRMCIRWGV